MFINDGLTSSDSPRSGLAERLVDFLAALMGRRGTASQSRVEDEPAIVSRDGSIPEILRDDLNCLRRTLWKAAEETVKVVGVCSANRGEGATTVALGLASLIASEEKVPTLYMDLSGSDGAPPGLESRNQDGRSGGVRALLDDRSSLEAELVVTGIDKLWILPDGRSANYSGFSAAKLTALLEEVKRKFDYVIVDSAAVNRNADAASMAACFDRTVIVVRAGVTRSPVVAKSVNELRRAGARIAGVVLNRREFVIPEIIYRQL